MEVVIGANTAGCAHPVDEADALLERRRGATNEPRFIETNQRQRTADRRKRSLANAEDADLGRLNERNLYTL